MNDMDQFAGLHSRWNAYWAGYAVAALIVAYGAQLLLPFADPIYFSVGCFSLAICAAAAYESFGRKSLATILFAAFVAAVTGILGGLLLCVEMDHAIMRSARQDTDCLRIQRAMQRPTPRTRKDLPDVFQALGCRVQR